jgi:hypothetical protein
LSVVLNKIGKILKIFREIDIPKYYLWLHKAKPYGQPFMRYLIFNRLQLELDKNTCSWSNISGMAALIA